jgi:hypothetical protein
MVKAIEQGLADRELTIPVLEQPAAKGIDSIRRVRKAQVTKRMCTSRGTEEIGYL